ncbi:MAG: hypothetical protein AMS24_05035 [Chlamydiae bacterium SM23_39]|nr:MAG: hypothetical protein AMS24_05035 [Chlamydiae bacterium SM23_39]
MNIAHYLTFLRILLIPFFPLLYLYPHIFGINNYLASYILLLILLICETSDIVDGILARKKNLVTDMGKIIDPMADTITHISVFFTFTQGIVKIPLILVFVLLYRELIISSLRTLCALKGFALAARKSGKIKTIMNGFVCILIVILIILHHEKILSLSNLKKISFYSILIIALYNILTAIDYFYANKKYLKNLTD